MSAYLAVIFSVLFGCNLLCWSLLDGALRAIAAAPGWPWDRIGLAVFMGGQIAGLAVLIGGRAIGGQPGDGLGRPLLSLIMLWNLLFLLPLSALSLLGWLGAWLARFDAPAHRTLVRAAVCAAPALALLATAVSLRQLGRFRVHPLTVSIPGLPPALEGLTIAHVSDLHVGHLTRGRVLDAMTEAVNRLDADLVAVTGDLVNFSLEDLPRALEVLRGMRSRHGLYACEGNHDLIQDAAAFEERTRAAAPGLRFLFDERARLSIAGQAVELIGLRWGRALPPGGEPGAFPILLAHHPDAFDLAAQAGIPLTLAGHTHGGQLMLTRTIGFGPRLYRYWSGLYAKGVARLVVSNGAGNWFPLRLNTPAEIVHITLRQG